MKRLVLLLLAVLLVLDLAHDGSLGKVKCVSPDSSVKVSHASPYNFAAGKLNDLHFLKYAVWLGSPIQSRYQPLVHGTHQAIRIIDCCHRGSSGGIPL
jgi:hypothetical protein